MKKIIAIIGMLLMISVVARGVSDLDSAKTWLDAFKGIFWGTLGVLAFWSFVDDFKNNKWPFSWDD